MLEKEHYVVLKKGSVQLIAATLGKYPMGWRYENVYPLSE